MLKFADDYSEGCFGKILEKLAETNYESVDTYGDDIYCRSAKEKIKAAAGCPGGEVFFLYGGTQTNQVAIDCFLEPYEGVIAARTGHVSLHEAGAIEFSGHKVIELPEKNGKLEPRTVEAYLENITADESREHMVFPGMVYISHPTEYGTLYTLDELKELNRICRAYDIKLYADGARLGYALACSENDVTLKDLGELTDAFYIGGTKVGSLAGEALVYPGGAPKHMLTRIKQHGALAAKGRLFGISFDVLFTDDNYVKIASNAIRHADRIREALSEKGYSFYIENPTNQIFIELTNEKYEELSRNVVLSFWERLDAGRCVVRCATSWTTREEDVEKLIEIL